MMTLPLHKNFYERATRLPEPTSNKAFRLLLKINKLIFTKNTYAPV